MDLLTIKNSHIVDKFMVKSSDLITKVYSDHEPIYSSELSTALHELNSKRQGIGHYAAKRYRLVLPPKKSINRIELSLAPLNFAFVALIKDEETPLNIRRKVEENLNDVVSQLPHELISHDPYFNWTSSNVIGTETCLLTSDGKVLLRKRGVNVLTSKSKWDVSVSGYAGVDDVIGDTLDFTRTIIREMQNELGDIVGDPQEITFLGLHRNTANGAIDLLCMWKVESTADQLTNLITHSKPPVATVFSSDLKARESYVWDTDNILLEFNGPKIRKVFDKANMNIEQFMPEALACLELALLASNCPPIGIGFPNPRVSKFKRTRNQTKAASIRESRV